jgi:hypothetical protein
MSSARSHAIPPECLRPGPGRVGKPGPALGIAALALLLTGVACAPKDTSSVLEALARGTETPTLESAIAMDKARIQELISLPDAEFSISFTQSPELNEIALRLPAFQRALRERESALDEATER